MRLLLPLAALAATLAAAPSPACAQGWTLIPRNRPARASETLAVRELAGLYSTILAPLSRCYLDELGEHGPPGWMPELSRLRLRFREGRLLNARLSRHVEAPPRLRECIRDMPSHVEASDVRETVEVVQVFQLTFTPVDLHGAAMRCTGDDCEPPPPDTPGRLTFNSDPWCNVFVDGREVGQTPVVNLELAPGAHALRCRNPDRADRELEIQVRPGRRLRRTIRLSD